MTTKKTTETPETTTEKPKAKARGRGFGALSAEDRKRISSRGGKAAHALGRAHRFTQEEAQAAGRLGGLALHKSRGRAVMIQASGDVPADHE